MSRKLWALLVALALLLALATYVYYRRTVAAEPVDAYALVPDDAVLVLTTRDHPALVRHLQEIQLWDNLTAVRYVQQATDHLAVADSLAGGSGRSGSLVALLGRKQVVTSVHVTGPGAFDVLYQVPLASMREYRQVRGLLETLGRDRRYRFSQRLLDGQELSVLTEVRTETSLTVFNYRNHLILSTNRVLVEAVVQRLRHPGAPTVLARFADTDVLRLPEIDAALWLNFRRLPQLLDVLFRPAAHARFDPLATLAADGLLGLRLTGAVAELAGFANPETARGALQAQVRGQAAQPFGLAGVLPTRTALVVQLAVRPLAPVGPAGADSVSLRVALDSLAATFGPEMAVAYLAAASPGVAPGRLAYLRCPAPARTARWLGEVRRRTGQPPAFTRVGGYEIHPLGVAIGQLLRPLLAPAAPGEAVPAPAGALVNGYLVLADAATLGGALADVGAGATWARTPAYAAFLARTLPRARLGIYLDTRNAWNGLLGALTEERRAGLLRNEALFKRFPQLAWQLMPAPDEAAPGAQYFSRLLLHRPSAGVGAALAGAGEGRGLAFRAPLVGTPLLVAAAGTRVPAALVQDSAGVAYFVSPDNGVVWADSLGAPLVGAGPLAAGPGTAGGLALAAGHRLHRLAPADGREAPPFPLNLPDTVRATALQTNAPAGAAPRLLVAAGAQALFLLDAKGREYPGWAPKVLDFPLAGAAALLSVGGRDVVVCPLQNGYVYAYDQRGGLLPGFPLSVGARLAGGVAVQAATTLGRTRLTVVNQHGELVTFTLVGDVLGRRRVATWSRTATFRLVPATGGGASYGVARDEEGGRYDFYLPPRAAPVVSRRFVTSDPKPTQFFDFGAGGRVVAVGEPGPGLAYVFDAQGRLLSGQPLASTGAGVGLAYHAPTGTYQLVRLVGRELRRTELRP
ncbi:hypothetical protein [Hymenobacter sp. PAMC 26628]|uniref:hypothetical protein n=1 Tax=Hymenobacter sp. PAMC 26628 TaxID=1484118 RepID=UPI0007706627|nr:hypothetical protein [Hymenobacter sp. PAMC 26628]AMJ65453.1 hypothetical protein AXW84_08440 [Hymenobacter sp. PAMC 26628]